MTAPAHSRPVRGGGALTRDAELNALLERARHHVATPDEIRQQRLSFIRGQCDATEEQILKVLPELATKDPRHDP